jgi:hypothetical protein
MWKMGAAPVSHIYNIIYYKYKLIETEKSIREKQPENLNIKALGICNI